MEWSETVYQKGSMFTDDGGNVFLLHSVGNSVMQLTDMETGDPLLQFHTTDGKSFCPLRDMPSESATRETIQKLRPVSDRRDTHQDKDSLKDELVIHLKDFSGALMHSIKEQKVDGEVVHPSVIVERFTPFYSAITDIVSEMYAEIVRDNPKDAPEESTQPQRFHQRREYFFQRLYAGIESLKESMIATILDPESAYPDVVAKFYFSRDGQIRLIIRDEKEDVLQYEGHLQGNNTVLTTRAMRYIIIPNLVKVLNMQD